MIGQKARCGKAEKLQLDAVLCFDAEVSGTLPQIVFGRPWSSVGAPGHAVVLKDESGAWKMAG